MKSIFLIFGIIFGYANAANPNYVGLVLGGTGGSNSIELVTKDSICKAQDVTPPLPLMPTPDPTMVAEYVDGKIYLCGAKVKHYNVALTRDNKPH